MRTTQTIVCIGKQPHQSQHFISPLCRGVGGPSKLNKSLSTLKREGHQRPAKRVNLGRSVLTSPSPPGVCELADVLMMMKNCLLRIPLQSIKYASGHHTYKGHCVWRLTPCYCRQVLQSMAGWRATLATPAMCIKRACVNYSRYQRNMIEIHT
jgi:hypothetical protein